MHTPIRISALLIFIILPQLSQAGWKDFISDIKQNIKGESSTSTPSLSEEKFSSGLKQALNQGVDKAIKELGKKNGFLNDTSVKIPMPKSLRKVEKGMRKIGMDKYADQFVHTMNHAAEEAVPETTEILIGAIKKMTVTDAINILKGEDDAATQYFKKASASQLRSTIKPIVANATNSVGLTEVYKKMIKKAGFLARYIDKDSLDIDQYVTNKTIDGLFIKIAEEEKRIREDPVARSTDILRDVFGSLSN